MVKKITFFFNVLLTLYNVLRQSKFNSELKTVSDCGECYILGNGPSLKFDLEENLEFLKTQRTFAVNLFVKSNFYKILKPKYYVLADPNFWIYTGLTNKLKAEEDCLSTLHAIRDNTDWELVILIPYAAKNIFFEIFKENKLIKIACFNSTIIPVEGLESLNHYLYKENLAAPRIQNVLIAAIYCSINIGFSKINLLGADHSWTKDLALNDDDELGCIDHHFYDKIKPEFRLYVRSDGEMFTMCELLRAFAYMFEGYALLRSYADYKGVHVYNRCKGSFIDAFERKKMITDKTTV